MTDGESLLSRVAASIAQGQPSETGKVQKSILSQAAASYGRKPEGAESTIPTCFDPLAASLFEAVIEAAYLVANADGDFDPTERDTFERVFHLACHNAVQRGDVASLVQDLADQLADDGLERRLEMVASVVRTEEQRREVLRIAALMAHVSGGVDATERRVLEQLAQQFAIDPATVQHYIDQATSALGC
jgi:tellurite resistance protein